MLLNARVDLTRARAKIRAIGPIVRKTSREMLTQEARLVAISCAKASQPFGTGETARTFGRNRVAADIYKVYTTPGKAYEDIARSNEKAAGAFWSALNRGDLAKAIGILRRDGSVLRNVPIDSFDDGVLHMAKRHSVTGRVSKGQKPLMVVRDPKRLEMYIRKRQDNVGFGKSAWADIARQLGSIRGLRSTGDITANWITRQRGPNSIVWSGTDENPIVTLTSRVRYASQILPDNMKRAAVGIARNRLQQSILTALRAEMRDARLAA
jgi:hypothetical protein